MQLLKSSLLGSAAALVAAGGAYAADLPVKKALPIEYVRVCTAYGAGFFYIPGTDTCIRIGGRARAEVGFQTNENRSVGTQVGDVSLFRSLLRINMVDSGNALPASTNLLAYTATVGNGFSATVSLEDPNFRHNNVYNASAAATAAATGSSSANLFFNTTAPTPLIIAQDANGNATSVIFQDVIERSRLPDFVGVLRYDGAFGSAQISAAAKDINIGAIQGGAGAAGGTGFLGTTPANPVAALAPPGHPGGPPNTERVPGPGPTTTEGFAVQGGVKINLPFIAPGDTLYLQGAYGNGANNYTGVCAYTGCYQASGTPTNGGPFAQFLADAVLNPLTGRLQLTDSFSVVGSYLHYWTPSVRSAFYASYSETTFGKGARAAESLTAFTSANAGLVGAAAGAGSFATSPALFAISPILRDNYQIYAGASLIWSPVKDLDIGVEGNYINTGMQKGRVIDQTKTVGVTPANFNALLAAGAIHTLNNYDAAPVRFRVQRDF